MKLYPNQSDRLPRETVYHVPNKSGGISSVASRGTPKEVEARLEREFPLYRLRKVAGTDLNKLMGKNEDEI